MRNSGHSYLKASLYHFICLLHFAATRQTWLGSSPTFKACLLVLTYHFMSSAWHQLCYVPIQRGALSPSCGISEKHSLTGDNMTFLTRIWLIDASSLKLPLCSICSSRSFGVFFFLSERKVSTFAHDERYLATTRATPLMRPTAALEGEQYAFSLPFPSAGFAYSRAHQTLVDRMRSAFEKARRGRRCRLAGVVTSRGACIATPVQKAEKVNVVPPELHNYSW